MAGVMGYMNGVPSFGMHNTNRAAVAAAAHSVQAHRVYVGNLPYAVGWRELKDFMREAGEVSFAEVLMGPDGRSKVRLANHGPTVFCPQSSTSSPTFDTKLLLTSDGFCDAKGCGVVEFATAEGAQKAIAELSDRPLFGRPVFVREVRLSDMFQFPL